MKTTTGSTKTELYQNAWVALALGDKEKATQLVIQTYEQGMTFIAIRFGQDWMLRDLHGYPPLRSL